MHLFLKLVRGVIQCEAWKLSVSSVCSTCWPSGQMFGIRAIAAPHGMQTVSDTVSMIVPTCPQAGLTIWDLGSTWSIKDCAIAVGRRQGSAG